MTFGKFSFVLVLSLFLSACGLQEKGSSPLEVQDQNEATFQSADPELIALREEYDLSDWRLLLVNPWNPLPADFDLETAVPEGIPGWGGMPIDARIYEPFMALFQDAADQGIDLFFISGYRSYDLQQQNFNRSIEELKAQGYSDEEARAETEKYYAVPGYSEHHTGLAIDVVDTQWQSQGGGLTAAYDQQASFAWLRAHAADYGFILRYPQGKEAMTGIQYEPWHYRYVGVPAARYMTRHQLTLEEFLSLLEEVEEH